MARPFVSRFLLPLVRGGRLGVGRLLSVADVQAFVQSPLEDATERDAAVALALARQNRLSELTPDPPLPPLDPATWRLGAVVHNLLAMSHPRLATGARAEGRIERIAAVTLGLATLGPPASLREVLSRHSLLARMPEMIRHDHIVRDRLGTRTFVGRSPPGRALALGKWRGLSVESVRRTWLRDVGVPVAARATFLALSDASPLGEALDPLRLDPPPSWARLLSVLRFPSLCRAVAGRLVGMGVARVGDALTEALYRFASGQDRAGANPASPGAVSYGIRFLAHLVWLEVLFGAPAGSTSGKAGSAGSPGSLGSLGSLGSSASSSASSPSSGRELAVLLAAANETEPALLWPADVPLASELGQRFSRHLAQFFRDHHVRDSPRWVTARAICQFAVTRGRPDANAI